MQNEWNPPPLAGQPMSISELLDEMALLALPDGTRVVTIDEARNELPMAIRLLNNLQSLQDQAHDLTEELEILVEALPPHHEHVAEVADQLGNLVKEWQGIGDRLESTGANIAGFNPGHLEWHGVVDGHLVLYSWCEGEDDIEWWHPMDTGINGRRPLVEA
ncbi:MAG: DUF2203 family protein [Candidatus Poseidoniales archaeon]|nr:DUF2203 family protein [Candidatus Poseidoniales archaeon]RJV00211.1 MAG: DUF2203 family protein [Candidatus Poseidoniales archaeon]